MVVGHEEDDICLPLGGSHKRSTDGAGEQLSAPDPAAAPRGAPAGSPLPFIDCHSSFPTIECTAVLANLKRVKVGAAGEWSPFHDCSVVCASTRRGIGDTPGLIDHKKCSEQTEQ